MSYLDKGLRGNMEHFKGEKPLCLVINFPKGSALRLNSNEQQEGHGGCGLYLCFSKTAVFCLDKILFELSTVGASNATTV